MENFDNIDEHEICCYDLVSVDSKTIVLYFLVNFILFSLCFIFKAQKSNLFRN